METHILRQIDSEVQDFQNKQIQIVPGLTFNQHDTIEQIYFYFNSKFKSGDTDDEGDRKYFFNIVKNPCKVYSKAIDFDTKNIKLLTAGGGSPTKTWFMERDLKYWMRDKQFGKILNRLFAELPIFGSVVMKIVEGFPMFVDLRNFIIEQSAETLDASNYIIEVHNYTPAEFRKVAKQMKWDKALVTKCIELFHQMKDTSHIRVFERYGEVGTETNGDMTYEYKRVFVADVGVDEFDEFNRLVSKHSGIELSSEPWKGHPYWEYHVGKVGGRWLGIGEVETLFEPQIRTNELVNLQTKTSYWAALRLFQTRDTAVNRNLLTDARNGEVLNVDSEITQVDMTDRNLDFFQEEHAKWMGNRNELVNAYAPEGTTPTAVQVAQQNFITYFAQIQESIALDVKEMLYEVIIPQFEKEATTEHTLRLVGGDLDAYVDMVKDELVFGEMLRQAIGALNGGAFPTNQDRDTASVAIEQAIKQGKEKILTVPKNFYKDVKYDVDIDITGESVDVRERAATKFAILQAITADPTMLQDPEKRKMLASYAEDSGINMIDFFGAGSKTLEQMVPQVTGRAGGGVSAPNAMPSPMAGTTTTTL